MLQESNLLSLLLTISGQDGSDDDNKGGNDGEGDGGDEMAMTKSIATICYYCYCECVKVINFDDAPNYTSFMTLVDVVKTTTTMMMIAINYDVMIP